MDDVETFVRRYSNWTKYYLDARFNRIVELPGISPMVMSGILFNHTIFLTLQDAGFQLPQRTDVPVLVEMDRDECKAAMSLVADVNARLETEGTSAQRRVSVSGSDLAKLQIHPVGMHLPQMASFSPGWHCPVCGLNHAGVGFCEHPWPPLDQNGEAVDAHTKDSNLHRPVFNPDWMSTKERELISLLKQENAEGRPCLIYVWNTGAQYRVDLRIETLLEQAGVKTLNASRLPSRTIQQRILRSAYEGTQAVLVNPKRVGTGTNLVNTPTVIFYQPVWSVYTASQAAARSHRPTQTRDVRVYWMITAGTVEEVIFSKVMEKMIVSEYVAGGDTEGYAAVLEAAGHAETFEEAVFNHIQQFAQEGVGDLLAYHKGELTNMVSQLNLARSASTAQGLFGQLKTGKLADEHLFSRSSFPVELNSARQLSFF